MENKPHAFAETGTHRREQRGSEYVGVAEVARRFGYHPVYIQHLCRTGKIPAIKVFSHWRIRRSSLESLIQGEGR